ncbi:MAG: GntR family transcriptional regulator [Nostocoides sp.]
MQRSQNRRRAPRQLLSDEIRHELQEALTDGTYALGERLPSEHDLAGTYGVSRGTLREILSGLERDGFVRRVHGVGTFVSDPGERVESALNIDAGVTERLVRQSTPSQVEVLGVATARIPPWIQRELKVAAGSDGLQIERVVRLDGSPAAHVVDIIPQQVVQDAGDPTYRKGSVYSFLEEQCGIELHGGNARIAPVLPTRDLARKLSCSPTQPLLRLQQLEEDVSGRAVLFSEEHYVPGHISLTVRRERALHTAGLLLT